MLRLKITTTFTHRDTYNMYESFIISRRRKGTLSTGCLGMTPTDALNYYNIVNDLQTKLGRQN
jgi:hypothetical protein